MTWLVIRRVVPGKSAVAMVAVMALALDADLDRVGVVGDRTRRFVESHLVFCKSVGTIIIRPPVPAVAFGGRRIAWALTRKRLLVEFLES